MVAHGFLFQFNKSLYLGVVAQEPCEFGERCDGDITVEITQSAGFAGGEVFQGAVVKLGEFARLAAEALESVIVVEQGYPICRKLHVDFNVLRPVPDSLFDRQW